MDRNFSAVYPGSFDPPTNGHLDIITRASNLFPNIIVAVTDNVNKRHTFALQERIDLLRKSTKYFKNVEVLSFSGLLADYLKKINSFVLIRGLRALSDFEYEFQMALMNRKLNKKIETIFLTPDQSYTFLSSSMVKEIAMLGGSAKTFVPKCVELELKKRFRNR
ncbi:MAG: pantetheine-phosphate adenylyltransferase [Endomicrobium sp.]|jgi:pantetheine-phosphate adenylyltransferase|nr:pantetheine-phosphate adenylyltransferase [Endomicrobium sp.]MDR2644928.1 pantetheine-phosphate adenylyltransferase [Endomicrobium sp.]